MKDQRIVKFELSERLPWSRALELASGLEPYGRVIFDSGNILLVPGREGLAVEDLPAFPGIRYAGEYVIPGMLRWLPTSARDIGLFGRGERRRRVYAMREVAVIEMEPGSDPCSAREVVRLVEPYSRAIELITDAETDEVKSIAVLDDPGKTGGLPSSEFLAHLGLPGVRCIRTFSIPMPAEVLDGYRGRDLASPARPPDLLDLAELLERRRRRLELG
jgi:hypothetical protein